VSDARYVRKTGFSSGSQTVDALVITNADLTFTKGQLGLRWGATRVMQVFTDDNVYIDGVNASQSIIFRTGLKQFGDNGLGFKEMPSVLFTCDSPSINTDSTFSTNVAMTGAITNCAFIMRTGAPTAQIIYRAFCPSNDFCTISFINNTAGSIDPASQKIGATAITY
jgi:hypothetical protein